MRLTVFAVAASSVAALVGFAGAANASATIDLIWADTGTDTIANVNSSSAITLQVILTAGPAGSMGAGVSVDYSATLAKLTVLGYASTPSEGLDSPLPLAFTTPFNTGSRIKNINSVAFPAIGVGTGLAAGQSHQLGTVTFHKAFFISGIFEIRSDADGGIEDVLNLNFDVITATTTFNSAFLITAGIPRLCFFEIEINALRGGSPTVTVGGTKNITAKARIRKGTAPTDTTIDTTLRIDAIDGLEVIDSQYSDLIGLEVGKGGQGDTLTMNINQCNSGFIDFVARFSGTDVNGVLCDRTRRITKTCN